MSRRISTMWRNADDTVRAHIYDRRDIGAECARGTEFDAEIFFRKDRREVRVGGRLEVIFGVTVASAERADVFYSKEQALDWLLVEVDEDMFPMKTPPDTYTQGWE